MYAPHPYRFAGTSGTPWSSPLPASCGRLPGHTKVHRDGSERSRAGEREREKERDGALFENDGTSVQQVCRFSKAALDNRSRPTFTGIVVGHCNAFWRRLRGGRRVVSVRRCTAGEVTANANNNQDSDRFQIKAPIHCSAPPGNLPESHLSTWSTCPRAAACAAPIVTRGPRLPSCRRVRVEIRRPSCKVLSGEGLQEGSRRIKAGLCTWYAGQCVCSPGAVCRAAVGGRRGTTDKIIGYTQCVSPVLSNPRREALSKRLVSLYRAQHHWHRHKKSWQVLLEIRTRH